MTIPYRLVTCAGRIPCFRPAVPVEALPSTMSRTTPQASCVISSQMRPIERRSSNGSTFVPVYAMNYRCPDRTRNREDPERKTACPKSGPFKGEMNPGSPATQNFLRSSNLNLCLIFGWLDASPAGCQRQRPERIRLVTGRCAYGELRHFPGFGRPKTMSNKFHSLSWLFQKDCKKVRLLFVLS